MGRPEKTKINLKERVDDTTIDLSLSDISEVPVSGIANFKRVTIIDLSSNKLTTLGKTFCTLTHITKLDLSKNQIKLLPDDISKLTNLRHLDLYNNKLEYLPLGFGKLKNLRYLDLKGNPLTPALTKIVGPCLTTKDCQNAARTTVKFFAEMQQTIDEDRQRALREEQQRQEAEKEEEQIEIVKEKTKGKNKKERKKEIKPKEIEEKEIEVLSPNQLTEDASASRKSSVWSNLIRLFIAWFIFACSLIFLIVRYPHVFEKLIQKLPVSYHGTFLYHFEKIREVSLKYIK